MIRSDQGKKTKEGSFRPAEEESFQNGVDRRGGEQAERGATRDVWGEEKRAHDERAAAARLEKGLATLGLTFEGLKRLPKGDKRKQALGWWLRCRASVGAGWIGERLVLGHRTSVSKAVGLVERGHDPELNRIRRKLEKIP